MDRRLVSPGRSLVVPVVVCVLGLASAPPASGQNGVPIDGPAAPDAPEVVARDAAGRVTVRAVRLAEPLVLDGLLRDPVYTQVRAIGDFVQQEPHEGEPATERTELWIFFDATTLYIAVHCLDSEPDRIIANEMRRDGNNIFQNDNVQFVLDTFYDRRSGLRPMSGCAGSTGRAAICSSCTRTGARRSGRSFPGCRISRSSSR